MGYSAVRSVFEAAAVAGHRPQTFSSLTKQSRLEIDPIRNPEVPTPEELKDWQGYEEQLAKRREKRKYWYLIPYLVAGPADLPLLWLSSLLLGRPEGVPRSFLATATAASLARSAILAPIFYGLYHFHNWLDRKRTPLPPSLQKYVRE